MKANTYLPLVSFVLAIITTTASATFWITHVIARSTAALEMGLVEVSREMGSVWTNRDQSAFVSLTELELERQGVTVSLPTVSTIKHETTIDKD